MGINMDKDGGLEHGRFFFSIYWTCHHPNWRTPSFFRGIPPTGDYFCGKTWFPANAPWNQASDKQRKTKKKHPRIGWRTLLWWGLTIYPVPGFGLLFCGGFTNWMLTLYTYNHTIMYTYEHMIIYTTYIYKYMIMYIYIYMYVYIRMQKNICIYIYIYIYK